MEKMENQISAQNNFNKWQKNFSQNIKIAKAFNNYYISIAISNMTTNQEYECLDSEEDDHVLKIVGKY